MNPISRPQELGHASIAVDPAARRLRQRIKGRAALWFVVALWSLALLTTDWRSGAIGDSFVHGPLLAFHELGHLLAWPFGETPWLLGGTVGQLALPLGLAVWMRRRDAFAATLCGWLAAVSLLDVAAYLHDALHLRMRVLAFGVGEGGVHDWKLLLDGWGLTGHAAAISATLYAVGALGVCVALGLGARSIAREHIDAPVAKVEKP